MSEREQFEAWARGPDGVLPEDCTPVEWDGCEAWCYCLATSQRIELTDEWAVWQASRAAALEEAAKIADDASPDFEHDDEDRGRGWMASHLADHYRTLAQGGGK